MSPCYCSSCDKSLRLPLARLFKQTVQTELLTFAVAVTLDTLPRSTIFINRITLHLWKSLFTSMFDPYQYRSNISLIYTAMSS